LTILGILIGSAVVVGLVSATQGFSDTITGELGRLGSDKIIMTSASSSKRLTAMDERRIARIPNIESIVPLYMGGVQLKSGREVKQVMVIGLDQEHMTTLVDDISVKQGNFVSRFDAGGILLGSKVADPPGEDVPFARLNGGITMEIQQLVGEEVELKSRTFIVRGIMAEYGSAMMFDVDNMVFISLEAARSFFGFYSYSAIFIDVWGPEDVNQAADKLEDMFGDDVDIITSQQILEIVESITGVITLFLGGIAAISLVVAGIGIANIMFVSVMERTREIGVLKALGFQRGDILWLFLSEALLTGVLGGILGCGVGMLFGYGITSIFAGGFGGGGGGGFDDGGGGGMEFVITPSFPPNLFILAIGFAVIVAALAGLYPSWKAAKMDPVDALRAE